MNPVNSLDDLGEHAELRQRLISRAAVFEVAPRSLPSVSVYERSRPNTSRRASLIALAAVFVVVTLVGINIVTRRHAVNTSTNTAAVTPAFAQLVPSAVSWTVQPSQTGPTAPAGQGPYYSVDLSQPATPMFGQSTTGAEWTFAPVDLTAHFENPHVSAFGSTVAVTGAVRDSNGGDSTQRLPGAAVSLDGGSTWQRANLPDASSVVDSVVAEENSTSAAGTIISFRIIPNRTDVSPSTGVIHNVVRLFVMTPDDRASARFSEVSLPLPSPSAALVDVYAQATPNGFVAVARFDDPTSDGKDTSIKQLLTSADGTNWSVSSLPRRAAAGSLRLWNGQPVLFSESSAASPGQISDLPPVVDINQSDGSWREVDLGGIVATSCACTPMWSKSYVEAMSANDTLGITVSISVRSGSTERVAFLNTTDGRRWSVDWVDQIAFGNKVTTDWIVSGSSILAHLSVGQPGGTPTSTIPADTSYTVPMLLIGTPNPTTPSTTAPTTTATDQTAPSETTTASVPDAVFVPSQLSLAPVSKSTATLPPGYIVGNIVGSSPFLAWFQPAVDPTSGSSPDPVIVRSSDGLHWQPATAPPILTGHGTAVGYLGEPGIVAMANRFVTLGAIEQPGNASGTVPAVATSVDAGTTWTVQPLPVTAIAGVDPVLDATVSVTSLDGIAADSSRVMVAVSTKAHLDFAALIAHSHIAPNTVDETGATIDFSKATGVGDPATTCAARIPLLGAAGQVLSCPSMTQLGLNQATQTALLGFSSLFMSTNGAPFVEIPMPNPGWQGGNATSAEGLSYESGRFVISRFSWPDITGGAGGTGYPVVDATLTSRDGVAWAPRQLPCGTSPSAPAEGTTADRSVATCQAGAGDSIAGLNGTNFDRLLQLLGADDVGFSPASQVVTADGITIVGLVHKTSDVTDPNNELPPAHTAIVLHSTDGRRWSYDYVGASAAGGAPPTFTEIGVYQAGNRVVVYGADRTAPGKPTFMWVVRSAQ